MDGYLLVDKPAGWTSFDVVAKVRRIIKDATGQRIKIGHTGTLDPFATGLMILVLGSYTKRASEFNRLDKTYEAQLTLGKTSSTGDPEGDITDVSTKVPSKAQVKAALGQFKGRYMQMPPSFSAKKIEGQRAYKLARAGKEVKLEPAEVEIYEIEDIIYEYPRLSFTVAVSSGTYIRSLAEDIGQKLGIGAYMSALRRIRVGSYSINDALGIAELDIAKLKTRVVK